MSQVLQSNRIGGINFQLELTSRNFGTGRGAEILTGVTAGRTFCGANI